MSSGPGAPAASKGTGMLGADGGSMRHFWMLTGAAAVSKLGNTFLNLAMPWVMLKATGSASLAAFSFGVQMLPYVFSPLLGSLVDRCNRRHAFIASELLQGLLVASIPFLVQGSQAVLVLAVLFLVGCGSVASELSSDFSLVPALAPAHRVAEAYSRYAATTWAARCVGPAAAGAAMSLVGSAGALWIDAATFLLPACVAMTLPVKEERDDHSGSLIRMIREGFRSFRELAGIRLLTASLALHNLGGGSLAAIVVVVAETRWQWGPGPVGLALAAGAAGTALGSLVCPRIARDRPSRRRIEFWFAVCLCGAVMMLVGTPVAIITGFFVLSLGEGGMNVTTNEYRFKTIPKVLIGRVNAIIRALIVGATALSSLILGFSASLDTPYLWMAPAFIGTLASLALWRFGSPDTAAKNQ